MQEWLQKRVKYVINGYVGIVTAYAVYDNGRTMLLVEGIDTTGRPIEMWIDIIYAEIVE